MNRRSLLTLLGASGLGACTVGIYPTSVGEEVVHVLTQVLNYKGTS